MSVTILDPLATAPDPARDPVSKSAGVPPPTPINTGRIFPHPPKPAPGSPDLHEHMKRFGPFAPPEAGLGDPTGAGGIWNWLKGSFGPASAVGRASGERGAGDIATTAGALTGLPIGDPALTGHPAAGKEPEGRGGYDAGVPPAFHPPQAAIEAGFSQPTKRPGPMGWTRRRVLPNGQLGSEFEAASPEGPWYPIRAAERKYDFEQAGGRGGGALTSHGIAPGTGASGAGTPWPQRMAPGGGGLLPPGSVTGEPGGAAPYPGHRHHGGEYSGGYYGGGGGQEFNPQNFLRMLSGIPGMPPIFQFILRSLMGAGGGGARPPFDPTGTTPTGGGTPDKATGDPSDPYGRRAGMEKILQQTREFLRNHPEAKRWMMSNGLDPNMFEENFDHNLPAAGAAPASGGAPGGAGPGGPVGAPAGSPAAAGGAPAAPVAPGASGASATPPVPPQPAAGSPPAPDVSTVNPFHGIGENLPALWGADPSTYGEGLRRAGPAHGGSSDATPARSPAAGVHVASLDPSIGAGALGPLQRERQGEIRSRESAGHAAMEAAGVHNFGQDFHGGLASQRDRFRAELNAKPWLKEKFLDILYNEQGRNAQGTQAVAESAMNRALVRGTSLEQQLRWHGHERGGYYAPGNMGRGSQRYRQILQTALDNALNGSNIADYATDNSSGSLARRERATGSFRFRKGYTGESFFAPGHGEPGLARAWDRWMAGLGSPEIAQR
jgi:hypothetical protein